VETSTILVPQKTALTKEKAHIATEDDEVCIDLPLQMRDGEVNTTISSI
jgi:hypothetical protein